MVKKPEQALLILGAGGLGHDVAEMAELSGQFARVAFLDDNQAAVSAKYRNETIPVAGRLSDAEWLVDEYTYAIAAFGNNELRMKLIGQLLRWGYDVPCVIHRSAYVSPYAHLGTGCIIRGNAYIGRNVRLGTGCLVNVGAMVDHNCVIGDGVHLGVGCVVRNEVTVESMRFIEHNSVIE